MSAPTFDCYLCGTSNSADADFCRSCSGQLLKLPQSQEPANDSHISESVLDSADTRRIGDSTEAEIAFEDQFGDVQDHEPETPGGDDDFSIVGLDEGTSKPKKKKKRLSRSVNTSIDDMALSDALGLEDDESDLDRLDIEVTSIPTVRASENIPRIGTDASKSFTETSDSSVGRTSYLLLSALLLATLVLGYNTFFRDSSRLNPDSLGFVETSTTAPTSTTTTEAPVTTVDIDEIDFAYSATIVRVIPFNCASGDRNAIGEPKTGIALDERTVILSPDLPAEADAINIVSRTGASRTSIVSQQDGIRVATSGNRTTRHLDIVETAGEADYFVGYDFESNDITTTDAAQNLDAEISVSSLGHVHEVRIGSLTIPAETLAGLDVSAEFPDGAQSNGNVCVDAANLELITPIAELNSEGTDEGTEAEEADAGLEEADAN